MKRPTSVTEYRWIALHIDPDRPSSIKSHAWMRAKDMKRDIAALGGEWDIFKKVRHRICRKKVVLEDEAGYWEKDQT